MTFMDKSINIRIASGEQQLYIDGKLRGSLERSGASLAMINDIIYEVEKNLYEGITSKKIYKIAYEMLKKKSRPLAGKYKLKRAIMELGPSGYPFEQYFGEILKNQGYDVEVGTMVDGHCVRHEVDIRAQKDNRLIMVECKFHNSTGMKNDVKIPLYINSRFHDIRRNLNKNNGLENIDYQGWIVTNTRFTDDAIKYGNCAGLHLIGWDFPKQGSLKERIELSGLYPITCLSTLTKREKQGLLDRKIVLCRSIIDNEEVLNEINVNRRNLSKVQREAEQIVYGD